MSKPPASPTPSNKGLPVALRFERPTALSWGRMAWGIAGSALVILALLALGCQRGVPGLKLPGATSVATQTTLQGNPTADDQGHFSPPTSGAPYVSSLQPPDAGPGAQILISGQNLVQPGLSVRFGNLTATYSVEPTGSLLVTVPAGAVDSEVGVALGSATAPASSRPFLVIASLSMHLLDTLPGRIGYPLHLSISALDTAGAPIASPDVTLSVDPPGAAQVTGYGQVTPLRASSFTIQAVSGLVALGTAGAGCGTNFLLGPFAGDGSPSTWINGVPLLSENATDVIPLDNPDDAAHSFLNNPQGMVPFDWDGKPGVLFSDTDAGLLRFAPYDGSSISVVVGGAQGSNTDVPNGIDQGGGVIQAKNALTVRLYSPTGLAIAPDPDFGGNMVVIADTGVDEIVAWNPANNLIRAIAGTGLPVVSTNSSNSAGTSGLGDGGGGEGAGFTDPIGVAAVAGQANTTIIYVADSLDQRIRRIQMPKGGESAEMVTTLIGTGIAGSAAGEPDGASDSVDLPSDVAVLPNMVGGAAQNAEVVYVADTDNDRVLAITGDDNNPAPATISDQVLIGSGGSQNDDILFPTGLAASTTSPAVLAVASSLGDDVQFFSIFPSLESATASAPTDLSCAGQADPALGIIWPRTVMFAQVGAAPQFTNTTLYMTDFFSDTIRKIVLFP